MTKSAGGIIHTVGGRYRVNGSGVLKTSLNSLDDVTSTQIQDITMHDPTKLEPTFLANFKESRVQLLLCTIDKDAIFRVSKIVLFVKPVAESYPIGL